jgi:hypothetical protein
MKRCEGLTPSNCNNPDCPAHAAVGDAAALTDDERELLADSLDWLAWATDAKVFEAVESIISERVTTARAQATEDQLREAFWLGWSAHNKAGNPPMADGVAAYKAWDEYRSQLERTMENTGHDNRP